MKRENADSKKPKLRRILLTALCTLAVLATGLISLYMIWERPPERRLPETAAALPPAERGKAQPSPTPKPTPEEEPGGVYTLLLVGNDDGNGNTDTIMLGRIDADAHSMRFVSIPRDTLINADWEVRKINAVYWSDRLAGGNGIDALRRHIRMLTGIEPDCYAVVDLEDLVRAVDLMGGVWFDVPSAMHYDDPTQDLHIHLQPGYQQLNGEQVMGLCRYRSGYVTGDYGRIEMQHRFLQACREQFADLGKIPRAAELAELLSTELETDLTAANIAWLFRQALRCRSEDVRFSTLPTVSETIHGYSYAVVSLWDWLPLLNEQFNPGAAEITAADLDLVYKNGGGFAGTSGLRGSGYYSRQPPSVPAATAAPAAPSVAPTPGSSPGPQIITVVPGAAESPEETGAPATVVPETPAPETPEPTPGPEATPGEDWIAAVVTE